MVVKKMKTQRGDSSHHLLANHLPANLFLFLLVAAERSEAALGDLWFRLLHLIAAEFNGRDGRAWLRCRG